MTRTVPKPNVCVIDYYLDGYYHHWEQIEGKNFPIIGHSHTLLDPEQGEKMVKVMKIQAISEDEYHVMLASTM